MIYANRLYSYDDLRVLHLEPTARCQAACPMCGRNKNGGATRRNLPLDDVSIDDFESWFPVSFLRQLKRILMCGNYGDPIMAHDCLEMLAHARASNPEIRLTMNTNGSARKPEFWKDLAALGVVVNFALDGATAESHKRYRRNTNFEAILENATTFIGAGGRAVWDMLAFSHNEHEIDDARNMAERLGFRKFAVRSSNRFGNGSFPVKDAGGATIDELNPSSTFPPAMLGNRPPLAQLETCNIRCKVKAEKSIYVSASGYVLPCCWLGAPMIEKAEVPDSRFNRPGTAEFHSFIENLGETNLNLRNRPLPVIVNRYFPHIARRWGPGETRLIPCAQTCGQHGVDPFKSLFVSDTHFEAAEDQRRM